MSGFKTEGEGYAASLRQQASWIDGSVFTADLDADELRAAADFIEFHVPGWQPIETAPKDGQRILVIYDGKTRVAAWGKTSHVPLYGFCLADQGVEDFDLVTVELWQPLPSPEVAS